MPPRTDLPEGTDAIIDGAMETGGAEDIDGFNRDMGVAGGGASVMSDAAPLIGDTAGDGLSVTAEDGNDGTSPAEAGVDPATPAAAGGSVISQFKGEAMSLKGQATDRVRGFADAGKMRATGALDEISRAVSEAADQVEERLGGEYAGYIRRASDAVSSFSETVKNQDVDELYDTARTAVRKSPGIAIAAAALVGFALVRVVKAGIPDAQGGNDKQAADGSKQA